MIPNYMVEHATAVINNTFGQGSARYIKDWADDGSAVIAADGHWDAMEIAGSATVYGALPRHTFLEPINLGLLRLVVEPRAKVRP